MYATISLVTSYTFWSWRSSKIQMTLPCMTDWVSISCWLGNVILIFLNVRPPEFLQYWNRFSSEKRLILALARNNNGKKRTGSKIRQICYKNEFYETLNSKRKQRYLKPLNIYILMGADQMPKFKENEIRECHSCIPPIYSMFHWAVHETNSSPWSQVQS